MEKRTADVPEKVGLAQIKRAIILEPMTEHWVWGKLQQVRGALASSMETTSARSRPRSVMVGRTVAVLGDDGWHSLKVKNPSDKPVTLRWNAKLADVHTCVAIESFNSPEVASVPQSSVQQNVQLSSASRVCRHENSLTTEVSTLPDCPCQNKLSQTDPLHKVLSGIGLSDIDIDSSEVSSACKEKQSIFSRDKLDCGKVAGFLYRI